MKTRTSKRLDDRQDSPLSFEQLARIGCERATAQQPAAMKSFAGWNGLVFDRSTRASHRRLGVQRLTRDRQTASWILTADRPYRIGLPALARNVMSPGKRRTAASRRRLAVEPVHHVWNARSYHPVATAITQRVARNAKGKRAQFTDSIDALIFGVDDRRPYFPSTYPWHCIGRLESDTGGSLGSAALVGRNLALTARHCIPPGDPFMMKFVPGYYNGQSTVGASFFSWVKSATYYEGSDAGAWDFALLELYQPLGDQVGFFGVRTYNDDWDDLNVWAAAGYPSMAPFNNVVPSYLLGVSIEDEDDDGDASELDSENQDNSRGNSGGPLWAVWPAGPYIVGVTSANHRTDYGPFGSDLYVMNASGKAMVDLVGLARLEIDTTIHVNPPHLDLGG